MNAVYKDYNFTVVHRDGSKEYGVMSSVEDEQYVRNVLPHFYDDIAFLFVEEVK